MVGLTVDGSAIAANEDGWPVMAGSREAGRLTSLADSPRLERNIALAMVPVECAAPGQRLSVAIPGTASAERWSPRGCSWRKDSRPRRHQLRRGTAAKVSGSRGGRSGPRPKLSGKRVINDHRWSPYRKGVNAAAPAIGSGPKRVLGRGSKKNSIEWRVRPRPNTRWRVAQMRPPVQSSIKGRRKGHCPEL